jgi:NDP-sugar pyrophosphorylase family protein
MKKKSLWTENISQNWDYLTLKRNILSRKNFSISGKIMPQSVKCFTLKNNYLKTKNFIYEKGNIFLNVKNVWIFKRKKFRFG